MLRCPHITDWYGLPTTVLTCENAGAVPTAVRPVIFYGLAGHQGQAGDVTAPRRPRPGEAVTAWVTDRLGRPPALTLLRHARVRRLDG